MIVTLREEEQDDIKHRDRCEGDMRQNEYQIEDLNSHIQKLEAEIKRAEDQQEELNTRINSLEEDIKATRTQQEELKEMRNTEHEEFVKAQKDDLKAIDLLGEARVALAKFYKEAKVETRATLLEETKKAEPRPETNWQGGDYAGQKQSGTGILAIIDMITVDLQMEMKTDAEADAEAQKTYEKSMNALDSTAEAAMASKVAAEKELSALREKVADLQEEKTQAEADLGAKEEQKAGLEVDCAWVKSHFESRRSKRKEEMQALEDAKNILAGMEVE
jgi:chromosome segregation ATPase